VSRALQGAGDSGHVPRSVVNIHQGAGDSANIPV
jgi:hypothetical protein